MRRTEQLEHRGVRQLQSVVPPQPEQEERQRDRNGNQWPERLLRATAARREADQQDREQNVEVLLDGQRPGMVPEAEDIVLDEEEFGDRFEQVRVTAGEPLYEDCHSDHHVEGRIDLQAAPQEEAGKVNLVVPLEL